MSKTVRNVKNSLKYKANARENVLSLKLGQKRFNVPVEARLLAGGDYVFLSFTASSELYKVENGVLVALEDSADAGNAQEVLTPKRRGRKKKDGAVQMPAELAETLAKIPAGHKLVASPNGGYRLVRTRVRRKKGE